MATVADQFLVGRAAELASIDRALIGLCGGAASSALMIEGEPGIGKTRLLAELARRAGDRGCTVLEGTASELESDLPFWIFVDALDEYVAGLDPRVVGRLPEDVQVELAQVLPSMSERVEMPAPVLQDERYRVPRALRELLERLAARQPLVLVLDDLHWADPTSVDLLAALLRGGPDASVLLVLAARPHQVPRRLGVALDRAERHGGLTRLPLAGLSRDAARDLLDPGMPPARLERLYEETGGNPFYLLQLARSDGAGSSSPPPGAGGALEAVGVPRAVIASLAEELALLAARTQQFLRGAAVAGDPFELDLAVAAAGVDAGEAGAALDELLALDLVRRTDIPRRFRFRHPLVRRAVYEAAPGGWLLGAHERSADLLAARRASATARAHHVEFAARAGDLAAVAVLADAGEAALLRAPASAVRWYSAALRLLPSDAPRERRVALTLARARGLAAQGRLVESHADLVESIRLAPRDPPGLGIRLATTCAGVERLLGRHDEAHGRLMACFDQLPDRGGGDAIALMLELAIDSLFRSNADGVRHWARQARAAAEALGDRPLLAAGDALSVLGHILAGDVPAAQTAYARAATLVAAMPDDELGTRPDAISYLCSGATFLDRYDEACAHGDRAMQLGRATGQLHPTLVPALGAAHMMRGRLALAAEVLDAGVEAARLVGVTQGLAWALRNRSLVASAIGDRSGAVATAEEALELTQHHDESVLSSWAALAVARAAMLDGRSDRAVEVLAGAHVLTPLQGVWRALGYEVLTSAFLDAGRSGDASTTAGAAAGLAELLGLPMAHAWAQRAAARVALDAGAFARAAEHARASAAAAESVGVVVEAALTRFIEAQALKALGDAGGAAAALDRATETFAACGADRHRHAAEQQLRRLGRTVHRRSRPGTGDQQGLAALSGRELEVARLVADRHTNQEIADRLFLSLKTVESHMRNMFRKLDVSSRVELARAVERDAADPGPD